MNIFKLSYTDKAQALADLETKGILIEGFTYGEGVQAVVEIGEILLIPATYDEECNEITFPVYADGYHYDVMSDNVYDFGANLVVPKNPKHAFAGHDVHEEV